MLVDSEGRLSGIFTDSDLARLFEGRRDSDLDRPIREVMTSRPLTIGSGSLLVDAVALMARRKISELPVVDAEGRPVGLVDVTDLVGMLPEPPDESPAESLPTTPATTPRSDGRTRCRVYREPE